MLDQLVACDGGTGVMHESFHVDDPTLYSRECGNGTLIGASANVIVAGMAQREGHPISFIGFLIWSIPTMLISVAIGAIYLHIRFFM